MDIYMDQIWTCLLIHFSRYLYYISRYLYYMTFKVMKDCHFTILFSHIRNLIRNNNLNRIKNK